MAAGLVRGVYVDTLDRLIDNSRGNRVNLAVLLHQGDKLRHVHGLGLLLIEFSVEELVKLLRSISSNVNQIAQAKVLLIHYPWLRR